MKEERHIIWTDYGLDYEDWRDDLEADYPDLSEDERISLMYEINGDTWMMNAPISMCSFPSPFWL